MPFTWGRCTLTMSPSPSASEARTGFVSLTGAGPGDPKLITLRGLERLRGCDVVVYDRLIPMELLGEVPASSIRIDVGKIPGHTKVPQEEINRILIDHASRGLRVVRLKGGDPVIFGRVGEEASALAEAGIPFEIIPGVTAASGAAAAAGIPLTHRGSASAVTLATVHEDPSKEDSLLDWAALARSGTLAFYMAGGRTREVGSRLIHSGMDPNTPIVMVHNATLPDAHILGGTLASLAGGDLQPDRGVPFVLVVGEVAGLAPPIERLSPLAGISVVLTHGLSDEPDPLMERLSLSGAEVLACPCIEIIPPDDLSPLEERLRHLKNYDWILFTSRNAVDAVVSILTRKRWDARQFGDCRIAAVGAATARKLEKNRLYADLIPPESMGRALAQSLLDRGEVAGKRFLFPASEIAREELPSLLQEAGGSVDRITAYRTVTYREEWPCIGRLKSMTPSAICFSSPSAARGFLEKLGDAEFRRVTGQAVSFSIGKTTTAALKDLGIERIQQAEMPSMENLFEAIRDYFSGS